MLMLALPDMLVRKVDDAAKHVRLPAARCDVADHLRELLLLEWSDRLLNDPDWLGLPPDRIWSPRRSKTSWTYRNPKEDADNDLGTGRCPGTLR